MAKVNIEYDTKTKKMSLAHDGKKMPNVHSASFYKKWQEDKNAEPQHGMQISTHKHDPEHDTHEMHQVCASLLSDGVEVSEVEDAEAEQTKLTADIHEFLDFKPSAE